MQICSILFFYNKRKFLIYKVLSDIKQDIGKNCIHLHRGCQILANHKMKALDSLKSLLKTKTNAPKVKIRTIEIFIEIFIKETLILEKKASPAF